MSKVNNKDTSYGVFVVKFGHISHLILVILLLTLKMQLLAGLLYQNDYIAEVIISLTDVSRKNCSFTFQLSLQMTSYVYRYYISIFEKLLFCAQPDVFRKFISLWPN